MWDHFSVSSMTPEKEGRMRCLQQKLARQKRGSKGRQKTKELVALLHQRIRRRRTDALHRMSLYLARNHILVVLEALKISNMTRSARCSGKSLSRNVRQKAGLNRAILSEGWSELHRQVAYKGRCYGSGLLLPAHHTYSSEQCAACGYVVEGNRKGERFLCLG